MFATLVLAAATAGIPPCWEIFDRALRTSAAASHPAYVTYDESILIQQNNERLIRTTALIDYRDDGLARIRDERFDFEPVITRHTEPGPPELGPYGAGRDSWLPQAQALPTIASVRAQGALKCEVRGIETYKGHRSYHLAFSGVPPTRPSLKGLWVDVASNTVWKVIVSGWVDLGLDTGNKPAIADFEVELGYAGSNLVVNHVVWMLHYKQYGQTDNFFGEYVMDNYAFPSSLPPSYFGDASAGALTK